jgi:hypothetical protein
LLSATQLVTVPAEVADALQYGGWPAGLYAKPVSCPNAAFWPVYSSLPPSFR